MEEAEETRHLLLNHQPDLGRAIWVWSKNKTSPYLATVGLGEWGAPFWCTVEGLIIAPRLDDEWKYDENSTRDS
jgi:hypothetical protein